MRAGFLIAEALLQSDSTTMQAKRPQATRMLKLAIVACTGAANNTAVHWTARRGVVSLKQLGKLNLASQARLNHYALRTTSVWGRI